MKTKRTLTLLGDSPFGGSAQQWLFFDGQNYNVITMDDEIAKVYAKRYGAKFVDPVGELVEALELTTATVELHTGNGVRKQPEHGSAYGFTTGNVDFAAVAAFGRATLAQFQGVA